MMEKETKSMIEVTMVRKSWRLKAVNVRTCITQRLTKYCEMRQIVFLKTVDYIINAHPR